MATSSKSSTKTEALLKVLCPSLSRLLVPGQTDPILLAAQGTTPHQTAPLPVLNVEEITSRAPRLLMAHMASMSTWTPMTKITIKVVEDSTATRSVAVDVMTGIE